MPMKVAPPGRFSITTGWPTDSATCGPTTRSVASSDPPAGNGAMTRIGFVGKDCPCAPSESASIKAARPVLM
jgi:hypothetical protein